MPFLTRHCIKKLRNVKLFRQRRIRQPIRSRYANICKHTVQWNHLFNTIRENTWKCQKAPICRRREVVWMRPIKIRFQTKLFCQYCAHWRDHGKLLCTRWIISGFSLLWNQAKTKYVCSREAMLSHTSFLYIPGRPFFWVRRQQRDQRGTCADP